MDRKPTCKPLLKATASVAPATVKSKDFNEADAQRLTPAIDAFLRTSIDGAQKAFRDRPAADNWNRCVEMMHAWQFWTYSPPELRLQITAVLSELPISQWPERLAEMQAAQLK